MPRRVVMSDLHFGDPECALQLGAVAQGLREFLWSLGDVEELILAGDILDANISSLTDAMFGSTDPPRIGVRDWLLSLRGDAGWSVKRIVYVPGNHDYKVWDLLATYENFVRPIAEGRRPDRGKVPLQAGRFSDSFLRGLSPVGLAGEFVVVYPDHMFHVADKKVLVTHGHYLDSKQTMGRRVSKLMKENSGQADAARRLFFQCTAQYQALANAVSYVRSHREGVDWLHKNAAGLADLITGFLRDEPIDAAQLEAIEEYLKLYRAVTTDVFVFGHTHQPGHCSTLDHGRAGSSRLIDETIDVWNTGCFLRQSRRKAVGSLLVIDDAVPEGERFRLIGFAESGVPGELARG